MSEVGVTSEMVSTKGQQPLKQLNSVARRPPVTIEFQDLSYSVDDAGVEGGVEWSSLDIGWMSSEIAWLPSMELLLPGISLDGSSPSIFP
ncbi:hypothetical protein JTB14_018489 [Gonioctena quinquepunctata]|nr:hypothetical protein JTB14_018489 [Gonioctena quinquepunctata]